MKEVFSPFVWIPTGFLPFPPKNISFLGSEHYFKHFERNQNEHYHFSSQKQTSEHHCESGLMVLGQFSLPGASFYVRSNKTESQPTAIITWPTNLLLGVRFFAQADEQTAVRRQN